MGTSLEMNTRFLTVAVAALLVLAGCSGAVPGIGQDGTDRPSYGVDGEVDGNESTDSLAPGLTDDGVENISLLVERHFEILENESGNGTYVARTYSNTTVNETLTDESEGRHVVQYPDRRHYVQTESEYTDTTAETTSTQRWDEESNLLVRHTSANRSVDYHSRDVSDQPRHPAVLEAQVEVAFGMVSAGYDDVTVEERTQNGTTWYVVTNEEEWDSSDLVSTATVHIRADGLLMRVDETTRSETWDGESEGSHWRLEFEITPDETLERPDWYEAALEETTDD